jgi:predicted Zn-dependent protease
VSGNYYKAALAVLMTWGMASSAAQSSELPGKEAQKLSEQLISESKQHRPVMIEGLSEDEWIIRAIWLEENGAFAKSREVYDKLYAATGKKEYLFKEVSSSIYGNTHISESLKKLKRWSDAHPDDLAGRRLLLALYMNTKSFEEAAKIGNDILQHSDKDSDLELAANPYLYAGNFKKGVELLEKLYRKSKNENVLLRIAAIEAQYLHNRKKAIQLLETHRRIQGASENVYKMLIDLYIKEENIDRVLEVYKALYEKDPKAEYLNKIIEIYVYNRDYTSLIRFLESNHANDDILYDLYKKEKQFKKAIKLSETFYLADHDPRWLAEKAILLYEDAKDKNDSKMLEKVISLFEEALAAGVDDSIYLNYYGYTLIDKDLDLDKGIELVKKALKQQPENSYYLDSLAWGYYKKKECLKAYNLMEKVVSQEGTDEPEIKEHWEKIQQCQKPVVVGSREPITPLNEQGS